jgi:hypothetical protein
MVNEQPKIVHRAAAKKIRLNATTSEKTCKQRSIRGEPPQEP